MTAIKTYQTLSTELETIIAALQASDIDVDEALQLYERGQKTVQALEAYLQKAENQVRALHDVSAEA